MSKTLLSNLRNYLEKVSGAAPALKAMDVPQLPLFMRDRYTFFSVELFGRPWQMILENDPQPPGTAGEYEAQAEKLTPQLGSSPVFVFPSLPSNTRDRLVQRGVPFIVPGNQAFLPSALVDLREHFPRSAQAARASLSPTAQLTVLYHLQCESLEGVPLRVIAEKLQCSAMMLSKVKNELLESGICSIHRDGRALLLEFPESKASTWDIVKDKMTSPVKSMHWIRHSTAELPLLLAGFSALSRHSMIEEDPLPTYALGSDMFDASVEQGLLTLLPDSDTAHARIELWSYEPKLLSDAETVDPLSLYLAMRSTEDERVEQALEQLLEGITW
jgi:hypothetical protein